MNRTKRNNRADNPNAIILKSFIINTKKHITSNNFNRYINKTLFNTSPL